MREHGAVLSAHRWTVTVVALVALASLPTLAALSAGSATLDRPSGRDVTTPFIALPTDLPVVVVPQPPVALPPPVPTQVAEPARPPTRELRPSRRHRADRVPANRVPADHEGGGRGNGYGAGRPSAGGRAHRHPGRTTTVPADPCLPPVALGWRSLARLESRCAGAAG